MTDKERIDWYNNYWLAKETATISTSQVTTRIEERNENEATPKKQSEQKRNESNISLLFSL